MDLPTVATVIIAHEGMPCDPPIVEGYEFKPHPEDANIYLAEVPEEVAERWIRVTGFKAFGGKVPTSQPVSSPEGQGGNAPSGDGDQSSAPIPTDEAVDAIRSKADAAALAEKLKITLTTEKLEPMKAEIKAGLVALRAAAAPPQDQQ